MNMMWQTTYVARVKFVRGHETVPQNVTQIDAGQRTNECAQQEYLLNRVMSDIYYMIIPYQVLAQQYLQFACHQQVTQFFRHSLLEGQFSLN